MSLHHTYSPLSSTNYADWLSAYSWELAVSLTCRFPVTEFKLAKVLRSAFHRRLTRIAQRPVEGYYVIERHQSGQLHVHVLLVGVRHLSTDVVSRQWREGTAVARRIYDLTGAVRYAAKEIHALPDGHGFLGTRAERHRITNDAPATQTALRSPEARLLEPNELPF